MTPTGRFAPSPTGPLHAGSLVAALASWLDVRARGPQARWLVRIEDADTARCLPGLGEHILGQLAACGLRPDDAPVWQTRRTALYQAMDRIVVEESPVTSLYYDEVVRLTQNNVRGLTPNPMNQLLLERVHKE